MGRYRCSSSSMSLPPIYVYIFKKTVVFWHFLKHLMNVNKGVFNQYWHGTSTHFNFNFMIIFMFITFMNVCVCLCYIRFGTILAYFVVVDRLTPFSVFVNWLEQKNDTRSQNRPKITTTRILSYFTLSCHKMIHCNDWIIRGMKQM